MLTSLIFDGRLGEDWTQLCFQPPLTEAISLLPLKDNSHHNQHESVTSDFTSTNGAHPNDIQLDDNSIDTDSQSTGHGEPSSQSFMKMSLDGNSNSKTPTTISCSTKPLTSILNGTKQINSNEKKTVSFRDETDVIEQKFSASELHHNKYSTSMHPSITERLPQNTYYCDPPNLYVFPGAEIWWNDSEDESSYDEDEDGNGDDESDDDEEDVEYDIIDPNEVEIAVNDINKSYNLVINKQVTKDDEMESDVCLPKSECLDLTRNNLHQQNMELKNLYNEINITANVPMSMQQSVEIKSTINSTLNNKRRSSCAVSTSDVICTETNILNEHITNTLPSCNKKRKM